ncbi:hypothetical protein NC653_039677 [Populus alba x Populus x berolinensis]|uniref:Transmembrane protein n=1 Tax=Populus alba x Populus x berolinensis TaxID=444605 RepID=A0AAD6LBU8_9ROSI|nr:hypothetical protein NC653_039677 [Populus alba x Populus x berolinensis]
MEDWSTSYFLPLLSPLFLLFSDRFLPVRPVFCVCFVLLWPSVFARLLCIISVLAFVFLFVAFGLCVLSASPLCPVVSVFPGFFSFVRPLPMCSVCFVPLLCSVRGFSLFFSLSPFVLWFSRIALSPLVFLLFVLSSSSGSLGLLSVLWSSSSSSLVRPLVLSDCSQSSGLPPLRP